MNTRKDPREIAETILQRSTCAVKVGSCLVDNWGIHSWGHNHSGPTGYGEHAEVHCIKRCNRNRMSKSTLYVAAVRGRNDKVITARPCEECQKVIRWAGIKTIWYRDGEGKWMKL